MIPPRIKSFSHSLQHLPNQGSRSDMRHEFVDLVNTYCGLHCHVSDFMDDPLAHRTVNRLIRALRRSDCSFCKNKDVSDASAYDAFWEWLGLVNIDDFGLVVGLARRLGVLVIRRDGIDDDLNWALLHACVVEDLVISSYDAHKWCAAELDFYNLDGHYERDGVLTLRYQLGPLNNLAQPPGDESVEGSGGMGLPEEER